MPELVAPINRNLHELSKRLEQEYKEAMSAYIKGKKTDEMTMPTEPPMRMLVIPANSSASSFLKILGIMTESGCCLSRKVTR